MQLIQRMVYGYSGKAIVLAMGCRERTAVISIPGTRPPGITAGTAQRYINVEGYMVQEGE